MACPREWFLCPSAFTSGGQPFLEELALEGRVLWVGPAVMQLCGDGASGRWTLGSCPALTPPPSSTEACGSKSVYDGPEQEEYSTFVIDDPQETYKTLKQVIAGVGALEQEHAQYKRDKFKKTKYGSQ